MRAIATIVSAMICASAFAQTDDGLPPLADPVEEQALGLTVDSEDVPYIRLATWTMSAPGFSYANRDVTQVAQVAGHFDVLCLHGLRDSDLAWADQLPGILDAASGATWKTISRTTADGSRHARLVWRSDRTDVVDDYRREIAIPDGAQMTSVGVVRMGFRNSYYYVVQAEMSSPPLGETREGMRVIGDVLSRLGRSDQPSFACINSQAGVNDSAQDVLKGHARIVTAPSKGIAKNQTIPPYVGAQLWSTSNRPIRGGFYDLPVQLAMRPYDVQQTIAPSSPLFLLAVVSQ